MLVNMRSMALAAAVISGVAASECQAAKVDCTVPVVTYGASGGFGPNIIKGDDAFHLAGEPFSITLYVCESKQPGPRSGPDYSVYSGIELTGTVNSSLITTPYTIKPTAMTFVLVDPATGDDLVEVEGNLTVFGSLIFIHASIALPPGTLTSTAIAPFTGVAIDTQDSAFTYSYPSWSASTTYGTVGEEIVDPSGNAQKVVTAGTTGTTAPVWNDTLDGSTTDGTVVWMCLGPYTATELSVVGGASGTASKESGPKTDALLRLEGAQVIAEHADGSQSSRPLSAGPVDLLASPDKMLLQFYASGVHEASVVHLQIAGQDVPVRYSGASGYFPGLDEVMVEVPRSLAGRGQVEVALTVDGQTASPVTVHIQ